ncbi:MAG: hypothetical protein Q8L29_03895 [archaeon]|nr:hypothetical protein [archaeon]
MKKGLIVIGIVILILGIGGYYFMNEEKDSNELQKDNNIDIKISCPDYDNNQTECSLHLECEWISEENICNSLSGDEGEEKINSGLEAIEIQNTPSNELCRKIPLSSQFPYGERYLCLAIVNHNERFCEGVEEENENNMCLAYAKKDSSYCKQIQEDSAKHVCYYQLAVSSKNASFCSEIDYSQNEKEQCYFNFMSNLYQWGKSNEIKTEYCNQLDTPDKNTCLALKAKDISLCGDNLNCLTFFTQDLSFCEKFSEKTTCIKDRAKTGKNVSICELLSQPDRDICIGAYCTHTELNVNICDTITGIKERQERYIELAMNLANW